ncbi:MAG TPA: serine/threonine-protein kinase [Crinalium sp.]|jgi:WD40 repeat protein
MSYCLNLECPAPADQKTLNPEQARFCSNCGAKLLLNDRYRALRPIGQGGFGRTFLAVDELKPSRPYCVIKQFFREQAIEPPEKAAELFRQEAVRLDELGQHPQIPNLFAYCEQDQQRYLVQEFIDGQNLDQELRMQGVFDEAQIRELLTDLLPVLKYIHTHQVIHRDIKPENIIRRASDRHFVLVDFGASKFAGGTDFLKPGTKIGSQGYTAPEQAAGNATFSSDLYSLGATCLHLLTGLPPLALFNAQQQSWVWQPHLQATLSKNLESILEKLLQADLQRRYQTAEAVLHDLAKPVMADEPRSPQWDISSAQTSPSPPSNLPAQTAPPTPQPLTPNTWNCVRTLQAHDSWIRAVAFSPDGQLLVSGSGDKTLKIWSVETGTLIRALEEQVGWVRAIAISPNGKTLVTTANDKSIQLWDLNTGKRQDNLTGHTDWVRAIAFSPDGQALVTASQDKTAVVWDFDAAVPLQTLKGHNHWVVSVAISPDRQTIATGSRDQTIKLWHWESGKCRHTLTGHKAEVLSVAIDVTGKLLASSSADNTVQLWALNTGKHLHTITGHDNAVNAIAFSPDGKILATGSNDQTIKLWRVANGKLLDTLNGHEGWIWSVAFSPDSQQLASGSWDGSIKLWMRSP